MTIQAEIWPYDCTALHHDLSAVGADRGLIRRMAVLGGTPILGGKRRTSEGWPASHSLSRSGGPPSLKLGGTRSSLRFALRFKRRLERVTRLELATATLARWCSTN